MPTDAVTLIVHVNPEAVAHFVGGIYAALLIGVVAAIFLMSPKDQDPK